MVPDNKRVRREVQPAQVLVLGFALAILVGTVVLSLPAASSTGSSQGVLTALFTSTSAVCVTGLIVVNTGTAWSGLGQAVILMLVKIGGLGIMTMTTLFALLLGRRIGLRDRLIIQQATGSFTLSGVVALVRRILVFSLVFEVIGALLLSARFMLEVPAGRAVWLGVFHSISAFNNAGFSLHACSLQRYVADPFTNAVFIALIIAGSIGFLVMVESWSRVRGARRLSLHTRIVLRMTAALIAIGTGLILMLEYSNPATLGALAWPSRILAALFHSVTRTAGFNTLPTGEMQGATLLFVMVLMFIGGSPGSTAGGVKTTTFGVLLARMAATLRGRPDVELYERRVPRDVTDKALAVATISLLFLATGMAGLMLTEQQDSLGLLFEATSAFGTVGLSTGVTPDLSIPGKILITILMFTGRLGPVTLALAIGVRPGPQPRRQYPEERIIIG